MRSLWEGSLSFGLISIPVTLYSAAKERALDFSMLHKDDMGQISFKRVCKKDGREVPYEDIVKGFEYKEDTFVVLEDEDFKRASPEKSERIDIEAFVKEEEIPTKYYDKPYYLEPGKGADKAYVLFREALDQDKKVAVARMVFRQREDLVVVKPDGNMLLLNQLRFPDELRDSTELATPKHAAVSRKEISMAIELIEKMTDKFDPDAFRDTYTEKLEAIIKAKARGKKFKTIAKAKHEPAAHADLVAQLRASLEQHHR